MKKAVLAVCAMAIILLFPQAAVEGARNAMAIWCRSVAPVLFPFFVLMPMMTCDEACAVYERLFSKAMKKLFLLPGAAAPAILISMLAGSPAGAAAIARVASTGKMKISDARRMAMALCGLSPSFLILGIGQEMYGSLALGWKLAGIQAAVQIIILLLTKRMRCDAEESEYETEEKHTEGMSRAIENILAVCGYMVVFGAASAVVASLTSERFGKLALLVLDLPGGSAALSRMEFAGKWILQCGAAGFGGVCIAFQNMDVLKKVGVSWKDYLSGRILAAILFANIGLMQVKDCGFAIRAGEIDINIYAISLFFASIVAVPIIYSLEKDIFLNKRKFEKQEVI